MKDVTLDLGRFLKIMMFRRKKTSGTFDQVLVKQLLIIHHEITRDFTPEQCAWIERGKAGENEGFTPRRKVGTRSKGGEKPKFSASTF